MRLDLSEQASDDELECRTLKGVIELALQSLRAGETAPAFRFIPPSASISAIRAVSDAQVIAQDDGDWQPPVR